ncbi:capsid protein [Salmonella phage 37]|uniref:Capsid protein n=1 Tax=Salmonella phage 37 TaxID=1654890 RepID=A0A0N7CD32_9CAUD|nr:tail length tape measure protein [Salmonella phage 37]AKJ73900.1 capsid protein [Salmonella phage 37]
MQFDALKKIAGLTFSDVEEVKKMFAQVMEQIGKMKGEEAGSKPGQSAK